MTVLEIPLIHLLLKMPATTTYRKDAVGVDGDLMDKLDVKPRTYTERGLPPSFTQPLDEIEIIYCIEATATRPDIFKENLHTVSHTHFPTNTTPN